MNYNRRTLALAAAGLVTIPLLVRADEQIQNPVAAALTSTTISGYVDTSAQWNLGTGNANTPLYSFGGASKADGFNLNVVDVALDKPLDESEWAAGYHVELWLGPDANSLGSQSIFGSGSSASQSDFAIRQAYVALRTPVGNGIDWKVGVFDTVVGYESLSSPNNPNYTRSYGFSIEPTTHTGILGSYRLSDTVSFSAGIADTVGPVINQRAFLDGTNPKAESYKTYMGSISLTAPDNWGWLQGSTLSLGVVNGFNGNAAAGEGPGSSGNTTSWYAGATLATPVAGLKVGASYDAYVVHDYNQIVGTGEGPGNAWATALYASYQATEKLCLNLRGDYLNDGADLLGDWSDVGGGGQYKVIAMTATAQYDLWKNVLSRLEFRWDHSLTATEYFGGNNGPTRDNAYLVALNVIYKF